ncbi:hypothetical protein Nepgr_023041 [Nepenthes gracilis]|uniref:Uncharacterized protein n=1 Tax=Nepenthes gracilis TaxID=150966 RepID=A0AAD3T272_NEPGR|nr:hypothetical protein Nepgr_023041 [Nepenthes gracilis]
MSLKMGSLCLALDQLWCCSVYSSILRTMIAVLIANGFAGSQFVVVCDLCVDILMALSCLGFLKHGFTKVETLVLGLMVYYMHSAFCLRPHVAAGGAGFSLVLKPNSSKSGPPALGLSVQTSPPVLLSAELEPCKVNESLSPSGPPRIPDPLL